MTNLYSDVVAITDSHLGPTADRFVARQIRSHVQGDPTKLDLDDLERLIDWIQLAMRLVHKDQAAVDAYIAELHELVRRDKGGIHAKSDD